MNTLSPDALSQLLSGTGDALSQLRSNSDALVRLTRDLQDKQTLLEQIVDHIPAVLLVIDPAKKSILWTNDRLTSVLGYNVDDVSKPGNRSLNELFLKDERRHLQDAVAWFTQGNEGTYRTICRMNSAFDDEFSFSLHVSAFRRTEDGTPDRLLLIALDITQQTQNEQELKRMLREIVNPREDKRIRSITRRELQIVKLIAREMNTKQIADELNISIPTVETHRRNLLHKLNIKNTAGLVRFAVEQQLV